jgi:hypothetical protein
MELSSIAAATPLPEDGLSRLLPEELSNDGDKRLTKLSQMLLKPEVSSGLIPNGSKTEASELLELITRPRFHDLALQVFLLVFVETEKKLPL